MNLPSNQIENALKKSHFTEIEEATLMWFKSASDCSILLSRPIITEKAKYLAKTVNQNDFTSLLASLPKV